MIEDDAFRSDLWYRLAVMPVEIPPVRMRTGDITLLIDHSWEKIQNELIEQSPDLSPKVLSPSARNSLKQHQRPGNVREIQHVLTRLAVLTEGEKITRAHVDEALRMGRLNTGGDILNRSLESGLELNEIRLEVDRHYIPRALEITNKNKTEAAKLLGLKTYQVLNQRMTKAGIKDS